MEATHARAARGMLLMQRGRFREPAMDLRLALDRGVHDVEVPNALAFALRTGDSAQAAAVLAHAIAEHPHNINLKYNYGARGGPPSLHTRTTAWRHEAADEIAAHARSDGR
ncbi:MAG: hypothetical protein HY047_06060 [Acidobacteria bacterium]|nr:hypothetical protein [Acidobacteriota bacterium]